MLKYIYYVSNGILLALLYELSSSQTSVVIQRDEIWTDDFQRGTNSKTGWYLFGEKSDIYEEHEQIVYGYNGKPYHGPLDCSLFVCGLWSSQKNWLQRDIICAQNADVYVSYSFAFCNMDSNTNKLNLYTIGSTIDVADQYNFDNDIDGYLSNIDSAVIAELTDETGLGLGPECDGNVKTTWKYKVRDKVYIGKAIKDITYTVSFMVISEFAQNTLIYDIEILCDGYPTSQPTFDPTYDPTLEPTTDPTSDPTTDPTNDPTVDPTADPTRYPTSDPTHNPTFSPSISPTHTPTFSPIISPTNVPSFSPTVSPSYSPTILPTNAPSMNPSIAPSISPTVSPTNYPISSDAFDAFLLITYSINKLKPGDAAHIFLNLQSIKIYIESIIKKWYFDEMFLKYQRFTVDIDKMNDTPTNEIDQNDAQKWNDILQIDTIIECNRVPVDSCAFIKQQSQIDKLFAINVESDLQSYFNNGEIEFVVLNPREIETNCKYQEECITINETEEENAENYVLYGLASICGILILIGFFSFLYNKRKFPKCPGFNVTDDAVWIAAIVFSLHIWDFGSDILLSVEILTCDDFNFNVDNRLVLVSGIGSASFVLIPYLVNLWMAYNIKTFIDNEAAKAWFQVNTPIFVVLVVITGGFYTALSLVSSGIFGLKIMTSGITQYELKKLGKMKIVGSVLLENIPQLIFQIIYGFSLNGKLTNIVLFAGIASILSVISSTLSYCIESNKADTKVIQYYLTTRRDQKGENNNNYHLNEDEKQNIINNRGRIQCLSENVAATFGVSPKNIEIGYSTITKDGIITHIVHYVYDRNLEIMQQELNDNGKSEIITPNIYIEQLYSSEKKEISQVFRDHFGLNDDFNVIYDNKLSVYYTDKDIKDNINPTIIPIPETLMVEISASTNKKLEEIYDEIYEKESDHGDNHDDTTNI